MKAENAPVSMTWCAARTPPWRTASTGFWPMPKPRLRALGDPWDKVLAKPKDSPERKAAEEVVSHCRRWEPASRMLAANLGFWYSSRRNNAPPRPHHRIGTHAGFACCLGSEAGVPPLRDYASVHSADRTIGRRRHAAHRFTIMLLPCKPQTARSGISAPSPSATACSIPIGWKRRAP